MFGHSYYHGIIRKHTALVGTLFNDLVITRGASGEQTVKVPIIYGPREKYLARLERDPSLDQKTAVNLPMISFEMTGLRYASDRKLSTVVRYASRAASGEGYSGVYNPVPYDIFYDVNVYSAGIEDGARIVEQILPFFTPSWNATLNLLDDMPTYKTDVYVVLDSVEPHDDYDSNFETRRAVTWRLSLTVKTYFYGPVSTPKIIKIANTNIYADTNTTSVAIHTDIRPGLTANGEATSNSSLSVPISEIESDDDWGYVVTYEDNT